MNICKETCPIYNDICHPGECNKTKNFMDSVLREQTVIFEESMRDLRIEKMFFEHRVEGLLKSRQKLLDALMHAYERLSDDNHDKKIVSALEEATGLDIADIFKKGNNMVNIQSGIKENSNDC